MDKRFELHQKHMQYTDYESVNDGDIIRRVTIVADQQPWAYLTMRDYSEKKIAVAEAEQLIREEPIR